MFETVHNLDGVRKRFAPSFDIAQSWQRLISGQFYPHDITLLRHELYEMELVRKGYSQDEAHRIASKKHNYAKEVKEYNDSVEKH